MHRAAWAIACWVGVVMACGGSKSPQTEQPVVSNTTPAPPPAPPPDAAPAGYAERAMAAMRSFADQMCACADSACAKAVSDRMVEWSQDEANRRTEPIEMTEEEQKQATAIGMRMGECMQRAMSGSGGP